MFLKRLEKRLTGSEKEKRKSRQKPQKINKKYFLEITKRFLPLQPRTEGSF
jgi:hypothetical protein